MHLDDDGGDDYDHHRGDEGGEHENENWGQQQQGCTEEEGHLVHLACTPYDDRGDDEDGEHKNVNRTLQQQQLVRKRKDTNQQKHRHRPGSASRRVCMVTALASGMVTSD